MKTGFLRGFVPTPAAVRRGHPFRPASGGLLAAVLLAVAFGGSGCNTNRHQVNTVEPSNPAYVQRTIPDKRVVRDSSTAKAVSVLKVVEGTSETGLARVGVEVQNNRDSVFYFNYRFDWFDQQGLPVTTPASTMISQQIEGGQAMTLMSVAPSPNARDFRLSIQKSTRSGIPVLRKN